MAGGFRRTLTLQGVTFTVSCPNQGSLNRLTVVPSGLEIDHAPIVQDVDGTVTGAEVADLNVDGSPEIYVYVQSAGSGSYGSLAAFSANNGKALTGIHLPDLRGAEAEGYLGHDEFAVVESALVRRFPVYREGDANAAPSGGIRQLHYQLVPVEAGWQLRIDHMTEH